MWPAPTQAFTHVTPGGKVSTPTGGNAFLHALELNVRTELALAETRQPQEEAVGGPIEEWLSDPADAPRYEASATFLKGWDW